MGKIQAVIFDKRYWKIKEADKWLVEHGLLNNFKPVHVTKSYLRYRQFVPKKNKTYRMINFNETIKAVIEY